MPSPPPRPPEMLHLLRLAQAVPNQALALPDGAARVLLLTHAQPLPHAQSVICLQGEVILDFADGSFVHLRSSELCTVMQEASAMPVQEQALALLLG